MYQLKLWIMTSFLCVCCGLVVVAEAAAWSWRSSTARSRSQARYPGETSIRLCRGPPAGRGAPPPLRPPCPIWGGPGYGDAYAYATGQGSLTRGGSHFPDWWGRAGRSVSQSIREATRLVNPCVTRRPAGFGLGFTFVIYNFRLYVFVFVTLTVRLCL